MTANPDPKTPIFPIVGIGASAGGLAAFESFFSNMPAIGEPGMAFVLVQHLAPDHKSLLTELIRRYTRMQVFEVEDGMAVNINCAYIIPPNRDMAFGDGRLKLLEPGEPRGHRLPIDFFFRSLAHDQRERAVGIVLSGTGSDGALGVRAIKGEGGMVMVQSPSTSEFDGMPRSALATGLVDYELPTADMPAQLIAYAGHAFGKLAHPSAVGKLASGSAIARIFILLRAQTGHDFSQYKPNTIQRRIERRMAVHQVETIDSYARYLQQTPVEVEALFRDLLIGVTSFFRDPEAFQALEEQVIPQLFEGKPAGAVVRVWSTGCSTGEEAYSLAILLQERIEALKQSYTVQVFATDVDAHAIATARAGVYPASIAVDISPERLARFFTVEPGASAYRVHKSIRDMLIFSEQDLIKDPPFSKLDLVSCRNLLIYFNAELQHKLVPLFHYALNPGGMLFLGTSEGIGDFGDLFAVLDRKSKLFRSKASFSGTPRAPLGRFLPRPVAPSETLPGGSVRLTPPAKLSLRELTAQTLLQQWAPASALVNHQGDILYLHGRTGMYLELTPGVVGISNIRKMAREGLGPELSVALHKSVTSGQTVRCLGLNVKTNGHFTRVNLTVSPVIADAGTVQEAPLYLVMLEEASALDQNAQEPTAAPVREADGDDEARIDSLNQRMADVRIASLEMELQTKDEFLERTHEALQSSNEELKSSNEEMQSVNEELQSTNEELETSKEELQSVNEELATVNTELNIKVTDLSRSNNDMNNLLAGTGIATVFVDHQLRIVRFTPSVGLIINLIPSDAGRPIGHIVSNLLGYDRLVADVQSVIDNLVPIEVEVQARQGPWYTLRIQPYRTLDNVIEGAVITFVDITVSVQARDSLRQFNEISRLADVARDALDAIIVQDLEGCILVWNPGAMRMYGWSEAEALRMNARDRMTPELQEQLLAQFEQLVQSQSLAPYRTERITKAGAVLPVWLTATALLNEDGHVYAIATIESASFESPLTT